jgi:hypothetical protein
VSHDWIMVVNSGLSGYVAGFCAALAPSSLPRRRTNPPDNQEGPLRTGLELVSPEALVLGDSRASVY